MSFTSIYETLQEVYFMKNPCGKFTPPSLIGSPIGKGNKAKEKIKSVFGSGKTVNKFIKG